MVLPCSALTTVKLKQGSSSLSADNLFLDEINRSKFESIDRNGQIPLVLNGSKP